MSITTKIRRQGGAAVMTIPPALLKMMDLDVGDQLSLVVSNGELVARPVQPARKRYRLSELLEGQDLMAELNVSVAGAQDGEAVGHEIS
jgi:antitoxin ChpS